MAKKMPQPQPGIDHITLYTPGSTGSSHANLRKLSSNENLYGASDHVATAIAQAVPDLWRYPNVDHFELRQAIADVNGLPVEQIICGVGSDEILSLIAQAYAGVGDDVIMTEHGFEIYMIVTHSVGANLVRVAERERVVDVDVILGAVGTKTKIVYIANPANPTGTMLPEAELVRLAQNLPSDVLLVIDSAYAEFADGYDGGASLALRQSNVIMTRTFSKLYGLGGLRVGWALASPGIVETLNRIRGPFNLSNLALVGAKAAVQDQAYANKCREQIMADRDYMIGAFRQMGLAVDQSHANFVLVRFHDEQTANSLRDALAQKGYLVRSVGHYGLPQALRISVGTTGDCQSVVDIIGQYLGVE